MEVSEAGDNFYPQQEEFGTLEIVDFEDISFVFSQSWYIWAFALRGLDFKELFTVVE